MLVVLDTITCLENLGIIILLFLILIETVKQDHLCFATNRSNLHQKLKTSC